MNKQKGFTLIELLVVISILGVLSTLAVVSLQNARQKGRDAVRVADVRSIQNALELYYNDASTYPTAAEMDAGDALAYGNITYMTIPASQQPEETGCPVADDYTYTVVGNSYTLQYCLGAAVGSVPAGLHAATPSGICDDTMSLLLTGGDSCN